MSRDRDTGDPQPPRQSMGPEQRPFAMDAIRGRVLQAIFHAQSWQASEYDPYSFTLLDGNPQSTRPALNITLNRLSSEGGAEVVFRSNPRAGSTEQPFTYTMKFHKEPGSPINAFYIHEGATYGGIFVQHEVLPRRAQEIPAEDQEVLAVPQQLAKRMALLLLPNVENTHPAVNTFAETYSTIQHVVDAMHLGYAPADLDIQLLLPNMLSPVTARGYGQGRQMYMQLITNADTSLADVYLGNPPAAQFGHDGRINTALGGQVRTFDAVYAHLLFDAMRKYQEQHGSTQDPNTSRAILAGLRTLLTVALHN